MITSLVKDSKMFTNKVKEIQFFSFGHLKIVFVANDDGRKDQRRIVIDLEQKSELQKNKL